MGEKLSFIRFPLVLVFIFFAGRLALGAAGVSYETANRVFSMVILQVHVALIWAAVGRRYRGYTIGESILAVVMIVAFSQLLILIGTAGSYLTGADTLFNYPEALNSETPLEFQPAMMARVGGLVVNCIIGSIVAALGWALGGLIPERTV